MTRVLGPRARVLVVNDDGRLARSVQGLLSDRGYEARTANDGERALEILADWPADLVLLDLVMPRLDGFGFLQRQARETGRRQPAVLVWSVADDRLLERARHLGATECLPMAASTPDTLLATVSRLLAASG
jgi:two-component system chemotaxis response regulator CheY